MVERNYLDRLPKNAATEVFRRHSSGNDRPRARRAVVLAGLIVHHGDADPCSGMLSGGDAI
jgi:hypothetical protein